MPVESTEFISDSSAFGDAEVRKSILLHSRSALVRHQDTRPLISDVMPAHSLAVLGIRFSSGPCPAIIRPAVGGSVQHLRAGLYLDPYRSTRISREYGAMGLRQVELFNTADKPAAGTDKLKITLDLFPPPKQPAYLLETYSDARKRVFCHNHGTPLSSIIQITNDAIRTAIFDTTTATPAAGGDYAKIITPNGVTRVAWANSPKFQRALTEHGIVNPTGRRSEDASLRRAAENLVYSVDQARLYVSHALAAGRRAVPAQGSRRQSLPVPRLLALARDGQRNGASRPLHDRTPARDAARVVAERRLPHLLSRRPAAMKCANCTRASGAPFPPRRAMTR